MRKLVFLGVTLSMCITSVPAQIIKTETCPPGYVSKAGSGQIPYFGSYANSRYQLVDGWESRYYMQKTTIPVLEVEVALPGTITSRYRWSE